ncbi:hypothetical protein ARMSODRAFT_1026422 [Armillaria solidipes]|uniref:Uncharacterized protein n=1 Tax=Armillaria solidipes TaxID=1076256 RepID=A0A2H3B9K7_9AGAR|nr:hypothetical protein ARMSODRAFT_1026422 [Armillaria solidipes]
MTPPSLQQNTRLSGFQCETRLTKITELAPVTALGDFDGIITAGKDNFHSMSSGRTLLRRYVPSSPTPIRSNIHEESSTPAELLADSILTVERDSDRPAQELPRIHPRCTSPKTSLPFSEYLKEAVFSGETEWTVCFAPSAAEFVGQRTVERGSILLIAASTASAMTAITISYPNCYCLCYFPSSVASHRHKSSSSAEEPVVLKLCFTGR